MSKQDLYCVAYFVLGMIVGVIVSIALMRVLS